MAMTTLGIKRRRRRVSLRSNSCLQRGKPNLSDPRNQVSECNGDVTPVGLSLLNWGEQKSIWCTRCCNLAESVYCFSAVNTVLA